jgi:hypothetical protein
VEVDDDDRRRGSGLVDELVHHLPRGDRGRKKELAEQVQDGDADAVPRLDDCEAMSRSLRARVRRPDHALAAGEVGRDPAAAVGVVPERDHVAPEASSLSASFA